MTTTNTTNTSTMSDDPFTTEVLARIAARGWALPVPPAPAGHYQPYRLDRGVGYLAAQLPARDGKYVMLGRVGGELSLAEGKQAAALAALAALARIHEALGGFGRLRGLLRVDGFVASTEDFLQQPAVVDGASEVFVVALGDRGQHARTAFAVPRLPANNSIELVVTFGYD
jgi:enamine deaminase RidA (YjgF/YER057c/UK114 family)